MSNHPEHLVIISPLLSNKIDEICNMISSNLEEVKDVVRVLSNKVDGLEKKVKDIEIYQKKLEIVSKDYWTISE